MNEEIIQQSEALRPKLDNFQRIALIVGLIGIIATAAGYLINPDQFFRSYLLGFIYWVGLSLGSLAVLMLHHVAGGRWGFSIRRPLEASTRTLPLMFLFLLPILFFGLHSLYEWTHAEVVATDEILQKKMGYLNESFFIGRTLAYFAIWGILVFFLNRWSSQQDRTTESHFTRRMQRLSAPGIIIYALSMTLAAVDWIMSLEPHWFSTIFSAVHILGQILLTWAFMILVAASLSHRKPLDFLLTNERLRDLGTLMLGFVMLWTYTSFSQLLIIWAGNLPEEITWYMSRLRGGWLDLGYSLIALHFVVPFLLLISARIKSRIPVLVGIASGLCIMRLVALFWVTAPAFNPEGLMVHWLDIAAPVGIGGIWLAVFFWQLKGRSLIALNDPRFSYLLDRDNSHGHG
jgi:hypothetical protein